MKRIVVLLVILLTIPLQVKLIKWYEAEREYNKYSVQYPQLDRTTYEIIKYECERNPFPLHVALAFAYSESRFKHNARSYAGARGLFQIMPFHSPEPWRLQDPVYNAQLGVKIMKYYYKLANGNLILFCKYYNSGPRGRVYNGRYIMEIAHNIVQSEPDTKAIELLSI